MEIKTVRIRTSRLSMLWLKWQPGKKFAAMGIQTLNAKAVVTAWSRA